MDDKFIFGIAINVMYRWNWEEYFTVESGNFTDCYVRLKSSISFLLQSSWFNFCHRESKANIRIKKYFGRIILKRTACLQKSFLAVYSSCVLVIATPSVLWIILNQSKRNNRIDCVLLHQQNRSILFHLTSCHKHFNVTVKVIG